jgi:prephenate dehydrogenase
MAGSEKEGFDHANESIFLGRNYIFIEDVAYAEANPELHKKATEQLKELALAIGFSRTIETNAKVHDHKIAFTSQLCHVIASALVQSAEDTEITAFGGGSYEDLTRIAMINAPLWTELFLSNNTELVKHIEIFEKHLDNLKNLISEKNKESLEKNLHEVRKKRIAMNGKK